MKQKIKLNMWITSKKSVEAKKKIEQHPKETIKQNSTNSS